MHCIYGTIIFNKNEIAFYKIGVSVWMHEFCLWHRLQIW